MRITIRVKARSKENKIEYDPVNNSYIILVKALSEGEKANREIIRMFAKYFRIRQSQIKIISGFHNKLKILDVAA